MLYKIMPFKIESDDEKLICGNFFLSKKKYTIYFSNISGLEGGLFDGKPRGIMKVYDSERKLSIGFYQNISDGRQLGTLILSKVPRNVYDSVLEKVNKNSGKKI